MTVLVEMGSPLQRNLVGIYTIWLREVRKFWRDKSRIIGATVQPALFLLLLGTGIGRGIPQAFQVDHGQQEFLPGVKDYLTFIYPGIIAMTILFTAVFSAISIIWDREIGFLKEVMVAPISRWAVAIGKTLGGSTVAMLQGCLMLVFAPIIGVKLTVFTILTLLPLLLYISFSLTAMGIAAAARMRSMQGFTVIMNFLTLPMFFLSGAMFPVGGLPPWMDILVRINPLTYGVDILRAVVIGYNDYPLAFDLYVIGFFGLLMLGLAVLAFSERE
ncbi:MAG TPA: ABC transporter permease [Nitrospiria bacterium]|jgi:ABC-2 type transport system permease protein|nr:ABC transporter permease [Nitrospiria bacterium]